METMRRYGAYGFARLFLDLFFTKLFFKKCRIIRRPYYIRNSGRMLLGKNLTTGVALRIDIVKPNALLEIGNDVQINDYCHIGVADKVEIGNGTLIASKVFITDHQHGNINVTCDKSSPNIKPIKRPLSCSSVKIGDNVWIGENVSILPGVEIGDGSIIGASSVVTKSIPKNTIAVGTPAVPIKYYDFKAKCWKNIGSLCN